MKKIIFAIVLLLAAGIELYTLYQWFVHCINFQEVLTVDWSQFNDKVVGDINSDQGVSIWQTRLFYNKYSEGLFYALKPLMRFWDIVFLGNFISFTGLLGLVVSLWYFFNQKGKKIWQWILFWIVVLSPLLEIYFPRRIPFQARFFFYELLLIALSLVGLKRFIFSTKYGALVVGITVIVSAWWFLTGGIPFYIYCIQHATR